MTTEQTVDWSDPASLAVLRRIQAQAAWSFRRLAPVAILVVFGLYEYLTIQSDYLLIAAGTVATLIFLITRRLNTQLRRAALASGVCIYRLDDVLHIQNALGTFEIPLHQIDLVRSYPAGLIVQYAGLSTFTLPNGPVRHELEQRFKMRPRSARDAPGGAPPLDLPVPPHLNQSAPTPTQPQGAQTSAHQTPDDQNPHEPPSSDGDPRRGP